MRTSIAMISVMSYAFGYGTYLYLAQHDLLSHDPVWAGVNFAIRDGLTAYIFLILCVMALTCKSGFERAWLETGILFVSIILFWKVGYNLNLVDQLSLIYIIALCIVTGLISIIFFFNAMKHGLHREDFNE